MTALAHRPRVVDAGPRRPYPALGQVDYLPDDRMLWTQRHVASVRRRDGHTIDGTPGDCVRAATATLWQCDPTRLQHYAERADWWGALRRDARGRGLDLAYVPLNHPDRDWTEGWTVAPGVWVLADGRSPRGPFAHVVVAEVVDWPHVVLAHDPHPSRAGLDTVDGLYVQVAPYDPPPALLALP